MALNVANGCGSSFRWMQVVLAVYLWFTISTTATGIVPKILKNDTICNEESTVEIICLTGGIWLINESITLHLSSEDNSYNIRQAFGKSILQLQCLNKYNNSNISCYNATTQQESNSFFLRVQGRLGPVTNLHFVQDNQTLMWDRPHVLNSSVNISFIIEIHNISEGFNEGVSKTAIVVRDHEETYLELQGTIVEGASYNVSVRAVIFDWKGEQTFLEFHVQKDGVSTGSTDDTTTYNDISSESQASSDDSAAEKSKVGTIVGVAMGVFSTFVLFVLLIIGIVFHKTRSTGKSSSGPSLSAQNKMCPVSARNKSFVKSIEESNHDDNDSPMRNATVTTDGIKRRKVPAN